MTRHPCRVAGFAVIALAVLSCASAKHKLNPAATDVPPYSSDAVSVLVFREDMLDEFFGRGGSGV